MSAASESNSVPSVKYTLGTKPKLMAMFVGRLNVVSDRLRAPAEMVRYVDIIELDALEGIEYAMKFGLTITGMSSMTGRESGGDVRREVAEGGAVCDCSAKVKPRPA